MYRQQVSKKTSPTLQSTPTSKEMTPSRSYGSLSSVVQRAQQDPDTVSGDEWKQLISAIGTRATREILAGKQTPWVPKFKGISAQLGGDSGQAMIAPIQAKLTIGEVGDKYEQEADRVAKSVVKLITPAPVSMAQGEVVQGKERELEDNDLQKKPMVQLREATGGEEVSTDLESAISSARGSGQPLDESLQEKMGQAIGADFSGVRVHTDAQADQLNKSIQAKAFTTAQDIFFRQGAYEPGSRAGQELIAHELTHVVQQNGATVSARSLNRSIHIQRNGASNTVAETYTKPLPKEVFRWVEKDGVEAKDAKKGIITMTSLHKGQTRTKAIWTFDLNQSYRPQSIKYDKSQLLKFTFTDRLKKDPVEYINFEDEKFRGEAKHPRQVIVKNNEPGAYGLGIDLREYVTI